MQTPEHLMLDAGEETRFNAVVGCCFMQSNA